MPTGYWWWGSEAKGALGRPTRRWEYDIKVDIQEIRWEIVAFFNLHHDKDK
jgi:hypothetical protein